MAKCETCKKLVTKKSPGLQCGKCSKWFHSVCSAISNDQLTALVATASIDWKCRSCCGSSKPKRLSCILPDPEEEDNTEVDSITGKQSGLKKPTSFDQMLCDLRREVRDIIQEELQRSLSYYSDKIDDFEREMHEMQEKLKLNTGKLKELQNKNKNIELKYAVLEQKINQTEQEKLQNCIEVDGLKMGSSKTDIDKVANDLCLALKLDINGMNIVDKKPAKSENRKKLGLSTLSITLDPGCKTQWLQAAKNTPLSARDLQQDHDTKVYIREALTSTTAKILWMAKKELKESVASDDDDDEEWELVERMNDGNRRAMTGSIHRIREFELEKVCLAEEFDILQIVGEGWFGKILLVEHRATDKEMVLKALPKPYVSIRDFYREFHYGLHLSAHKNIVTTYDVAFETAGFYVFSQEYAPLGDLTSNLAEIGIGEIQSKRVAKQLAAALEHMHQRELVHRDVKLDNILIYKSDFSRIKLCDFGETRKVNSAVRRRNEWLSYSPPEVLKLPIDCSYRAQVTHDMWQFGIVIFICLTGCLPWQKAAFDDPRYLSYFNWYNSANPLKKQPKLFKMVSSKVHKLFKKYIEPRVERRAINFNDLAKFIDDRWMARGYQDRLAGSDIDELCPSMYSFHSDVNEKNILLKHFLEHGIETTVDRQAKKERIRDWIQNSVIMEETEEDELNDSIDLMYDEQEDELRGHRPSDKANQRESLRYATEKHFNPRTGEVIEGVTNEKKTPLSYDVQNIEPIVNVNVSRKVVTQEESSASQSSSNKDSAYGSLDFKGAQPNNRSSSFENTEKNYTSSQLTAKRSTSNNSLPQPVSPLPIHMQLIRNSNRSSNSDVRNSDQSLYRTSSNKVIDSNLSRNSLTNINTQAPSDNFTNANYINETLASNVNEVKDVSLSPRIFPRKIVKPNPSMYTNIADSKSNPYIKSDNFSSNSLNQNRSHDSSNHNSLRQNINISQQGDYFKNDNMSSNSINSYQSKFQPNDNHPNNYPNPNINSEQLKSNSKITAEPQAENFINQNNMGPNINAIHNNDNTTINSNINGRDVKYIDNSVNRNSRQNSYRSMKDTAYDAVVSRKNSMRDDISAVEESPYTSMMNIVQGQIQFTPYFSTGENRLNDRMVNVTITPLNKQRINN